MKPGFGRPGEGLLRRLRGTGQNRLGFRKEKTTTTGRCGTHYPEQHSGHSAPQTPPGPLPIPPYEDSAARLPDTIGMPVIRATVIAEGFSGRTGPRQISNGGTKVQHPSTGRLRSEFPFSDKG